MALTPQEADNLRKMLLEIERLSKALKQNVDTTNLQDLEKSADNIKFIFEKLNKEFKEQNDEISYAAVGFKRIVQEISNANIGLRESNKIYNNLSSLASQIQSHQQGISELSSKELANKKKKAELARLELENAQELLKDKEKEQKSELENLENLKKAKEKHLERLKNQHASQSLIDKYQKTIDAIYEKEEKQGELLRKTQGLLKENASILENQNELYKGLLKTIDEETQKAKNLEKALGLSGAAIDGIGKALNKAGLGSLADQMGLDEAKEKMKEVAHQVTKGGTKSAGLVGQFKILKAGIGSLGGSIMKNLTDPLVMAGLAAKAVSAGVGLIKKGFSLLKGGVSSVVGFVKNLWGMADQFAAVFEKYAKAGQFAAQNFSAVGGQVNAIRNSLNAAAAADPFMRVAEAGPALKAITDGTGLFASQMTKSVKDAHDLSYWLGYSAEETGKLERLGITQNKSSKEVLENIKVQGALLNSKYKTSVSQRLIEQTALKASAAVTFNLKQNPKALAEAAYQATKLNMTLDEIASAAEQTLDFESSIQNQLEYQALTGREINIDAYQQAALRGDTVAAAKELDKILQSQGAAIEGNVLNQEALAKTLGISKDKLLEARSQQLLVNKFGADRIDIEKTLQGLMDKHNISREEAAKRMTKADISNQLAASKRAEAMSRALEDFRDYMATRLWPLFKAVFSPANIKMFMTVINGMRPVFVELGKAITAFFSPKSAGAMTDVLKNDVMPAVLDVAKAITKIAGIFGGHLFNVLKENIIPLIKDKLLPLVDKIGQLLVEFAPEIGKAAETVGGGIVDTIGAVIDTIMDNKDEIKDWLVGFSNTLKGVLSFAKDNLGEITVGILALKGFNLMKSAGVFDFAKSVKDVVMGSPGSARNPLYVRSTGGGMGGEGGGNKWSDKSLGGKIQSTVATGAKVAAIGMAGYTAVKALTSRGEEDVTQQEVEASKLSGSVTTKYDSKIEELQKQGAERLQKDEKQLLEKLYSERNVYDQSIYELQAKGVENLTNEEKSQLQQLTDIKKAYNEDINKLETKNLNTEELASLSKLKQKQDQDVKEQIVSSQYQTGSKTGDLMLAGTEAAAGLSINTGGGMGALAGGIKSMLGFGKKETPTPAPDNVTPPSNTSTSSTPSGGGMGDGGVSEAKNNKNIVSKTIDSIKEIFKSLISFVKDIGKEILNAITEIIKGLGPVLNGVVDLAREVGKNVLKTLTTLIKELEPVLMSVVDLARNVGTNLLQTLTALLTEVEPLLLKVVEIAKNVGVEIIRTLGVFVDELKPVLMKIVNTVGEVGNALATEGMKVFNTIVDGLTQASNSLPTILGNLGKAIGSFFSGLGPGLVTFAELMATPTILFGMPVGLIVVGMAMGLAKAAQIAAPAIAALGPMFEGLSKVVGELAPVVEAAGIAIKYAFEGIGAIIESVGKSISLVITTVTDSILKLQTIDASQLLAVAGGIGAVSTALAAYGAGGILAGIGAAIGEFFGGDPIAKFNSFASIDAEKLNAVASAMNNVGSGIKSVTPSAVDEVSSSIDNLRKKLVEFFKHDYSDSKTIGQLKDLTTIDSSKITTLADAIDKLSNSFRDFGSTVSSLGNLDPVIKVTEHMLNLHKSIVENPADESFGKKLADGLKSSVETVMTGLAGFFGLDVDKSKDGIVHGKDAIVQVKDGGLNPNGGPVVSTFQQGQLKPVLQGIKEDNVYLTTNKPQPASTGGAMVDNSEVIAAINRLTEIMASSTDKKIVVDVKSDIPTFVSKVRQTSFGG